MSGTIEIRRRDVRVRVVVEDVMTADVLATVEVTRKAVSLEGARGMLAAAAESLPEALDRESWEGITAGPAERESAEPAA